MTPGPFNRWIVTGGDPGKLYWRRFRPLSLSLASGIGWEKEKLLLLCFRGKAQRKPKDKESTTRPRLKTKRKPEVSSGIEGTHEQPCVLEELDAGIFAIILQYLFAPFPYEVECKGSIFAVEQKPTAPSS